jgi:hypothetical protein
VGASVSPLHAGELGHSASDGSKTQAGAIAGPASRTRALVSGGIRDHFSPRAVPNRCVRSRRRNRMNSETRLVQPERYRLLTVGDNVLVDTAHHAVGIGVEILEPETVSRGIDALKIHAEAGVTLCL